MLADNTAPPTYDAGATGLSAKEDPYVKTQTPEDLEIVSALQGYWNESDNNRKSGLNPRDDKWRENLNLYWNRFDWSKKAAWQARETMPEVPTYVDRFAAAMKEALIATPEGFYTVTDPADKENDLANSVKRMTDVMLTRIGKSTNGQILPFSAVFEEQMKLGAIIACAGAVTWKTDVPGGRVAFETIDPRFVWLDHTGRNLYRVRRLEVDRHDLQDMIKKRDGRGNPIFNMANMESLINSLTLYDEVYKAEMAGHGVYTTSPRAPITLDEYIATVLSNTGEVLAERSLLVVANQKYLIRGPEKNPFWHGQDWMVYTPLLPTPLSVYGRTYMEDFGSIAKTFTELTNMILDAVHTVSLNAWAMSPSALLNPEQLASGISPNKLFLLEDGVDPRMFAKALELGTLPPESIEVWKLLKNELTEAASVNEIGLGQFAPKGRTSATEVDATQQSSSAVIRSIAQTVETRFLDIVLDLTWKTGLQHAKASNKQFAAAVGEDMWGALYSQRRELIERPYTFQARGISNTLFRGNQLKTFMNMLQIIGSNQNLSQAFFAEVPIENLLKKLFELSGIDMSQMQATDRQKMMQQVAPGMQQAAQQAGPAPQTRPGQSAPTPSPGANQMKSLARGMGMNRGA